MIAAVYQEKRGNQGYVYSHEPNGAQQLGALSQLGRFKGPLIKLTSVHTFSGIEPIIQTIQPHSTPIRTHPSPSPSSSITSSSIANRKKKKRKEHFHTKSKTATHPPIQEILKLRHGQRMLLHRIVKRILDAQVPLASLSLSLKFNSPAIQLFSSSNLRPCPK